jgi:hypothetical protein
LDSKWPNTLKTVVFLIKTLDSFPDTTFICTQTRPLISEIKYGSLSGMFGAQDLDRHFFPTRKTPSKALKQGANKENRV